MPTPFMHLQVAEGIKSHSRLHPTLSALIERHFSAFYLGSIAPDVQSITKQPRSSTHFYDLPPRPEDKAYPKLLATYPQLSKPEHLPPEQSVFVSAYCAHLMLDLRWYHEVLIPYFVDPVEWDDNHQRFVVHNTLLTYLDKIAVESLPDRAGQILAEAKPDGWLPFVNDDDLARWRDNLVDQLQPGAPLRTIEIYAGRLYMLPEEFANNLEEPSWMEEHLIRRVPVDSVIEMMSSAVAESVNLINHYFLS
ncbi:MAG: hypothetical protein AMJ56_08820 [Anaerolineae bacterium SG8_19]|nr:MAG: hypothetical protein AMJ56_08820 [Anaerolineae bacterium SG8_19]